MDKKELDKKITDAAKSILSYCISRTSSQFDAEDLAQDIILEVYKSAPNLKNDDAFYGFMWSVAGNVYKQWCKNKSKASFCELNENTAEDFSDNPFDADDGSDELILLRRELTLLSEKYRTAVILYYIDNKSCSEIADILSVSESMVKYLLFKSRQILKDGMNMERNYGQQSYNPKDLSIMFWGKGSNRYGHLCDSRISQNILFACYNDKLTAEQISLEIGVALPYMEDRLEELCEYDLLKKDGKKYYTNIVIFTKDFSNEIDIKTASLSHKIAELLENAINDKSEEIRSIGFSGADMGNNSLAWQIANLTLNNAVFDILGDRISLSFPNDKFGDKCFVFGVENSEKNSSTSPFAFASSHAENENGDSIQFTDYVINGDFVHPHFFGKQNITNVFLDIARGQTEHFSNNDRALIAEMIRKGYVITEENGLSVNVPVFTEEQYNKINAILAETAEKIADEAEKQLDATAKILKNHMPVHLKSTARDMAYLHLFENAISAPLSKLFENKQLLVPSADSVLPTTYVILK